MIDYSEMNKYYTGSVLPVITNAGGMSIELGEEFNTLLYKLDEDYYADVNHGGRVVQVLRENQSVNKGYIVLDESLVQVSTSQEIKANANILRRICFKPDNYRIK